MISIELPKSIQTQVDEVLEDGEEILDAIKEPWSLYKNTRWTVLTNERLIIVRRTIGGFTYDVYPLHLSSVIIDMNEGLIFFDTIYIDYYDQKFALQFFKKHRKRTWQFFHEINRQKALPEKVNQEKQEIFKELEGLGKIFYEKKITKEEYDEKKKELVNKL